MWTETNLSHRKKSFEDQYMFFIIFFFLLIIKHDGTKYFQFYYIHILVWF